MRRSAFIAVLGGAAAWPLAARAQQAGRTFRIGMVEPILAELNAANHAAFRLREKVSKRHEAVG
jgi:putative ABC transport system substrate-binding protein